MSTSQAGPAARGTSRDPQRKNEWFIALLHAGAALSIAALILSSVYGLFFFSFHPEFKRFAGPPKNPYSIQGDRIQAVLGNVQRQADAVLITGFNGGKSVVRTTHRFKAEDYPFIKVEMEGLTRFTDAYITWRLVNDLKTLHFLPLNRTGDGVTQIAMVYDKNYRGTIAELSLGFFDGPANGFSNNNNVAIRIHGVELRPLSPGRVVEQVYGDWSNPPLWQTYANNRVLGIHENGMAFPNLLLAVLVAIASVILILSRLAPVGTNRSWLSVSRSVVVVIGLCWILGDLLRWQWRIEQLQDTHARYAGLPMEERILNSPVRCLRFPKGCKSDLLPYF